MTAQQRESVRFAGAAQMMCTALPSTERLGKEVRISGSEVTGLQC